MSMQEHVAAAESAMAPAPPVPSSLAELAAGWITARIIAGDIRPGDRLTEVTLAQAAGMSRSPIREALRTLSAQGLVNIEPRRAATVALLSARDAADIYECRLLLEPRCHALALQEVGNGVAAELADCIDQMSTAAHDGNGRAYLDAATRYCRALQNCCPNKMLANMTSAALNSSLRYTIMLVRTSQRYLMLGLSNNMELHAAVTARDIDATRAATAKVLTNAREQLLELVSNIPAGH